MLAERDGSRIRSDAAQADLDRRLLYVALTRAVNFLVMTRSRTTTFTEVLENAMAHPWRHLSVCSAWQNALPIP